MNKNQSSVFAAISYSYISFIDEYLNLLKNPLYSTIHYLDEETAEIGQEMKTLFLSLSTLIGAEGDFKEAYAKKLVGFRYTLETKYRILNAYKRELQHLSALKNLENASAESCYEEFGLSPEDALTMDFDRLAEDCSTFVFASKNPMDRQMNASTLLPFIPMRMTKDSFLTYVEKSINKITIEDTKASAGLLVSILKQLLSGSLYEAYGSQYSDIATSIDEISEIKDLEQFFEEAELLDELIDHATQIVNGLYKVICTFSNLLIYDGLTFETLTDMHVSFYDLYCSIQGILSQSEDADIFLETLPERVNEIKEQLYTAYQKACQSSDIDPLFSLIQTYLMMDISHVFGFDTAKHPTYSLEVNEVLKEFLGELKEFLNALAPRERKLRMQYFMSVIPLSMNQETFTKYVLQGFKNTADPSRNLFTAMYLSNALEAGGYFEALSNEGEEQHYVDDAAWLDELDDYPHAHHHHECGCGDDCNCDHDDPNHSCTCGHDHH
ncbi:MAG: hypothetical protein ACRC1P_04045 [Cellulosilyticaceae bacterium]